MLMKPVALALVFSVVAATPAAAIPYLFEISGDLEASFVLDSSPVPDAAFSTRFEINDIEGSFAGVAVARTLYFFTEAAGGGLTVLGQPGGFVPLAGPVIFTGTTSAPTFILGSFDFTDFRTGNDSLYQLEISAVPEPASWGLLLAGFALTGVALRGRRLASC